MPRKKAPRNGTEGPDMQDAAGAVEALWSDQQLYFRMTTVLRDGHWLFRGYAHDGCSLADSKRVYQSYKRFEASGRPDIANVLYFLAYDLYWQAQSDEINHAGERSMGGEVLPL